jgi:hypothetical protein|tara:strand:- start:7490 stop:7735 length:246 start_codon:yes stop_codon:yes gene_type:complete
MIDTDKYVKFLTKHAPSTKKRIYVAETSSGRVQDDLWDIAMSSLIEVKRLREAIADIANNMEAADDSYMSGFIEDLRKVIE